MTSLGHFGLKAQAHIQCCRKILSIPALVHSSSASLPSAAMHINVNECKQATELTGLFKVCLSVYVQLKLDPQAASTESQNISACNIPAPNTAQLDGVQNTITTYK